MGEISPEIFVIVAIADQFGFWFRIGPAECRRLLEYFSNRNTGMHKTRGSQFTLHHGFIPGATDEKPEDVGVRPGEEGQAQVHKHSLGLDGLCLALFSHPGLFSKILVGTRALFGSIEAFYAAESAVSSWQAQKL